jgi:hypothetical protein
MFRALKILVFLVTFITPLAVQAQTAATSATDPCEQIKQTCEKAGFVKGQAKQGSGLWKDCIDPIMQGKAQPKDATLKLPTLDPAVVSACKAKRPNWGQETNAKKRP